MVTVKMVVARSNCLVDNISPLYTYPQDHSIVSHLQMNINVLVKPRDWASIRMISLRSVYTRRDRTLVFTLLTIWSSVSVLKVVILLFKEWLIGLLNWNHQVVINMAICILKLWSSSKHPGFRFNLHIYGSRLRAGFLRDILIYIFIFWIKWCRRIGRITIGMKIGLFSESLIGRFNS
jgi:hypothetical protein